MNSQSSKEESVKPIALRSIGDNKTPIENENWGMDTTKEYQEFIKLLQEALFAYHV